jgi:hypothetical protein
VFDVFHAVCAAGAGSHVKGWNANDKYPVKAPSCRAFVPGQHTLYKAAHRFPPTGGGQGRCYCFKCPIGYNAKGGALNTGTAQCTKQPVFSVFIHAKIHATNSRGCSASVIRAARQALETAVKTIPGVDNRTSKVSSSRCTGGTSQVRR